MLDTFFITCYNLNCRVKGKYLTAKNTNNIGGIYNGKITFNSYGF